jgi:peptide/nickel transport system substrate-binding protein
MRVGRGLSFILALGLAAGAAASDAAAQKSQDTLRLTATDQIGTISYYFDPKPDTVFESEAVFDGLVSYNLAAGRVEPLLAKSWTRIDPRTLEFELREDVSWHDGRPFGAADVVYTLRWLTDPKTTLRFKQNWAWIDAVEALGPHRVRVAAKAPTPFDLIRFAYVTAMLPDHILGKVEVKDPVGLHLVGTGPYRVVSHEPPNRLVLERNRAFRHGNAAKPGSNVGRIVIRSIPDPGTRLAHLLAGDADVVQQIPFEQAQAIARDPRFALSVVQGRSFMYVAYDAKGRSGAKPVMDERVRRALAMAIDRPALVELQAGKTALGAPGAMCWREQLGCDYTLAPPPFDPDGAKKLLAQAGYADGFDIEITTFTGAAGDIAEAVAGQWYKIGVRAKVDRRTVISYRGKQRDGKIQVMVAAWPAGNIPDVSGTVGTFFVDGPTDYTGDAALHALAKESASAMDPAARKAIGRKMFDLATAKVYFVPIAPFPSVLVHTKEVSVAPADRFTPLGYEVGDLRWR